jgi:hypothetical protein
MISMKKSLSAAAIAAFLGAGALVATSGTASARVVCNAQGDCWHTDSDVKYPAEVGVQVHPDDWYFHQTWEGSNRHYRDYHEGRGYYRSGIWITL